MPFMTAAVIAAAITAAQTAAAAASVAAAAAATGTAAGASVAAAATAAGAAASAGWGITAATIAADAALVSGAVGAFSSIQAGKAAEQLGKDTENIFNFNAKEDKRKAEEIQTAKGIEESDFRKGGEQLKAKQRTGFAKAGVTTEGSPIDYLEQTAIELEIDALRIRRQGTVGAEDSLASAQMNKARGRNALLGGRRQRRASYVSAAGQAVGGLGGAYNQYNRLS